MVDDKSYIIDPLTCLCKLALLHFLPEKTKLAISSHVMHIQEPSYYQCLERLRNGDSRIDISNLNTPILKAIRWYVIDNSMGSALEADIKIICGFAISGLRKLQNSTYGDDTNMSIIIQYFINLLQNALDNAWRDDQCVKVDVSTVLSDQVKNNFQSSMIGNIAKMLTDADKIWTQKAGSYQENTNALVDCCHRLLINRDADFVKMMRDINTA